MQNPVNAAGAVEQKIIHNASRIHDWEHSGHLLQMGKPRNLNELDEVGQEEKMAAIMESSLCKDIQEERTLHCACL